MFFIPSRTLFLITETGSGILLQKWTEKPEELQKISVYFRCFRNASVMLFNYRKGQKSRKSYRKRFLFVSVISVMFP